MHNIPLSSWSKNTGNFLHNMNYNIKVWVILQSSVPVTTIVIEGGPNHYQYYKSTLNQSFVCSIYPSFVFCCVLMWETVKTSHDVLQVTGSTSNKLETNQIWKFKMHYKFTIITGGGGGGHIQHATQSNRSRKMYSPTQWNTGNDGTQALSTENCLCQA